MRKETYNEAIADQAASMIFKGGIVPFDILNRMGGAVRGAYRGFRGSGNITNWTEAKKKLIEDLMDAFKSFEKSLWRSGYSGRQIRNIRTSFEKNVEMVIEAIERAILRARDTNRTSSP